MDELNTLQSLGFALPTPAHLAGAVLLGIIGFAAYRRGKKTSVSTSKWPGIALMPYPYAISETWMPYLVGVGLCIGLYVYRK